MSLFTTLREFVLSLRARRTHEQHGGAHSVPAPLKLKSKSDVPESTSTPKEWGAGRGLQDRTEFVESPTRTHAREDTVRITGSSSDEWIEGPSEEVRR